MNTQDKTSAKAAMRGFIDAHFDEQVSVLARLVQCPSDNPNRSMPSSRLGKLAGADRRKMNCQPGA
jgi:hypothetical protein